MEEENPLKEEETKPEEKKEEEIVNINLDSEETLVDRAAKNAELLKKENERFEENLKKQEKYLVDESMRGRSFANMKQEKKEDTPEEYADKVLTGEINPFKNES